MLRLAHRILSQKSVDRFLELCRPKMRESSRNGVVMAQALLSMGCPVILADNVCEYVLRKYSLPDEGLSEGKLSEGRMALGKLACDIREFPPCPPAFQHCFIEFNYPEPFAWKIAVRQGGAMIYAHCADDANDEETTRNIKEAQQRYPDARWLYTIWVFFTDCEGVARLGHYSEWVCSEDGRPIGGRHLRLLPELDGTDAEPVDIPILLHTLAFMQCRNVARVDVSGKEGPSPKWCRRERVPELKYHALQIDPNIGVKPRAGERKTDGDRSGKALHICRGHFAHFRDDGVSQGLFGRRQFGTFWIPAHTRGSLEHGKVISTYNVKTLA